MRSSATRPGIEPVDFDLDALVGRRIEHVVTHTTGIMNAREAIDRTLTSGLVTTVEHDVLDDTSHVSSRTAVTTTRGCRTTASRC